MAISEKKEVTPYLITTKLRLYGIIVTYFISMIFLIGLIFGINRYRILDLYQQTMIHQVKNIDTQLSVYLEMITDRLDVHVGMVKHELSDCKELKTQKNITQNATLTLGHIHSTHMLADNSRVEYISSTLFIHDKATDTYLIPMVMTPYPIVRGTRGSPTTDSDMRYLIKRYNDKTTNIVSHKEYTPPLHTKLNLASTISVDSRWYLITVFQHRDTNLYVVNAIRIYTDYLDSIISTYVYKTNTGHMTVLYPMLSDGSTGYILFHPIYKNANLYKLTDLDKTFVASRGQFMTYRFNNTERIGINVASKNIPWIITMVFNKEQVLAHVFRFNLVPTLAFFLAGCILLVITINILNTEKYLNLYKKQGVVCACEGKCIAERTHCKALLLKYKRRIHDIYEFFYKDLVDGDRKLEKIDPTSLLEKIDYELEQELKKFDDPREFLSKK